MTTKPRMPHGLVKDGPGQKLWHSVVASFDLADEPDKLRILHDACMIADYVKRLDDEAKRTPLTVRGSMGQPVINPVVDKAITARGQLASMLARLNFSGD